MSETKYIPTIGLEIHAELKTATKMFCDCQNNPDEKEPNKNICPICMGHPGTLPVINHEAVKQVIRVGLSVDGKIADYTEWDRKNYFYPDIPKGYQISQYKYPLVSGGKLSISLGAVELTRIHLEEDTGTSIHDRGDFSLVNYNRAGVPLMELVTEPVIHSAKQAGDFARELQLLLRYLGASEANMEKGEMRVEANISVSPAEEIEEKGEKILVPKKDENGKRIFGTKVEVKNLNSFKVVEKSIEYEIERMIDLLDAGKGAEIVQETRGWDEAKQKTFSQRKKESSDDYRYFPDPDLPKIKISEISEFNETTLRKTLPELPWQKRQTFLSLGLKADQADFLVSNINFSNFFDGVRHELMTVSGGIMGDSILEKVKTAANYITSDIVSMFRENVAVLENISIKNIVDIVSMLAENKISSRGAKDILAELSVKNGEVEKIASEKGLLQQSDEGALTEIVKKIITNNQKVADEYKAGKEASLQFLVGQGMKETRGSANPKILAELFKKELN